MSQTHRWGVPDAAGVQMRRACRIHFCIGESGNTFFVLAVCWRKIISNFLKFALFLQNFAKNFRGARCGRSVGYIFSIGNFGGKKNYLKLSLFFSNFLGIHFYVLAMAGNYLKLSLFFSNFLKFSQIISKFLICLFQIVSIFSTKYLPQMMGSRSGGGYR